MKINTRPEVSRCCLYIMISLIFVSIGGCSSLVDWHFKSKLDPVSGTIMLPGLKEPVTVRRDAYGIPFIEARTMPDLAMAIGYVNASDRLTQMVGMKLASEGRLAEMAGESVLNLDIYMRTLNLRRAAEDVYKRMTPENKALLDSYCAGVNAYIVQHKDSLPPGLALSGFKPERWKPIDSTMVFTLVTLSLSFNLHEEVALLSLAQEIGFEKTAWLSPIYPDEPIPFDEAAKLKDIDLKLAAQSMGPLADLPDLLRSFGLSGQAASNNWAIDKKLTKGGASIFSNDMHLYLTMPSLWNMMHVKCDGFNAAGMNVVGMPCIVAGYNGHIAWGMTMVMADNQDLFLEKLRRVDGKMQYLYKGQWLSTTERTEAFAIKGDSPVKISVHETVHGPLLNDALRTKPASTFQPSQVDVPYGIALSWAITAPDDDIFNSFIRLNAAKSVEEAFQVLSKFRSIPLNMVFADKDSIAWQVTGTYPVRSNGRGLMPSPGWAGEYDWTGLVPVADLPRTKNPATGFIGTANNRTVTKDYPLVLSSSWYWPERIERIEQMALATDKHTDKTNRDMQLDVYSMFVPKLKALLTKGQLRVAIDKEMDSWQNIKRHNKARLALNMIKEFDGSMQSGSAAAALISAFMDQATRNIFLDELGPTDSKTWKAFMVVNNESYNASCDHILVRGDESPFWDDIRTPTRETKAQIMASTLADAVSMLEAELGSDPQKWSWGELHTYDWVTDTTKMAPQMGFLERTATSFLKNYLDRGPYPASGDLFTLNVSAYIMGRDFETWLIPSMRMVVDFSKDEPMEAVNSSGQSDNPSSPHYDDGITAWRKGSYIPFPFKDSAVNAQYKDALILQPPAPKQP